MKKPETEESVMSFYGQKNFVTGGQTINVEPPEPFNYAVVRLTGLPDCIVTTIVRPGLIEIKVKVDQPS